MTNTPDLIAAYLKAEYRVHTAGGVQVLKVDVPSDFLARTHKNHRTDRSLFITGCNPDGVQHDEWFNTSITEKLNLECSERWVKFLAEGADPQGMWPAEPSFLVLGIEYRDAIEMAHRYGQKAFLYAFKEPVMRLYARETGQGQARFPYGYKPYFSPEVKIERLQINFIPERSVHDLGLSEKALALIEYIKEKGFVCPVGKYWDRLWKLLPDKGDQKTGWKVPLPLILSGWYNSDHHEKAERFATHLLWADEKKVIDQVDAYLRGLSDDAWLTLEEGQRHSEWLQSEVKRVDDR